MTTFELTDELLDAALRVDDQPVPGALRSAVRVAVANSARSRVIVPQFVPRPALLFAALTGLLAVALVLTALWFGSRSTLIPSPSPSPSQSPSPRPSPSPTVNLDELDFSRTLVSKVYGYSIRYPDSWQATAAVLIPKCCYSNDVVEGDGAHLGIRTVGPLSDCPPSGQACATPLTPAQEQRWINSSLSEAGEPCRSTTVLRPITMSVGPHVAQGRVFDCGVVRPPLTALRLVVGGVGYQLWYEGTSEQLLEALLATVVFDFDSPGVAPTPTPLPSPPPDPTPVVTPWVLSIARPTGLDTPNTTFAEFSDHVSASLEGLTPILEGWARNPSTLEAYIALAERTSGWIRGQENWIPKHHADACYWFAYNDWLEIVNETAYAAGRGDTTQNPNGAGQFGTVRNLLNAFSLTAESTCLE